MTGGYVLDLLENARVGHHVREHELPQRELVEVGAAFAQAERVVLVCLFDVAEEVVPVAVFEARVFEDLDHFHHVVELLDLVLLVLDELVDDLVVAERVLQLVQQHEAAADHAVHVVLVQLHEGLFLPEVVLEVPLVRDEVPEVEVAVEARLLGQDGHVEAALLQAEDFLLRVDVHGPVQVAIQRLCEAYRFLVVDVCLLVVGVAVELSDENHGLVELVDQALVQTHEFVSEARQGFFDALEAEVVVVLELVDPRERLEVLVGDQVAGPAGVLLERVEPPAELDVAADVLDLFDHLLTLQEPLHLDVAVDFGCRRAEPVSQVAEALFVDSEQAVELVLARPACGFLGIAMGILGGIADIGATIEALAATGNLAHGFLGDRDGGTADQQPFGRAAFQHCHRRFQPLVTTGQNDDAVGLGVCGKLGRQIAHEQHKADSIGEQRRGNNGQKNTQSRAPCVQDSKPGSPRSSAANKWP